MNRNFLATKYTNYTNNGGKHTILGRGIKEKERKE